MAFIIVLVAMLIFMYFLLIRPQRAKQRQAQEMLANLKPGDEVITIGGIYGDVIEVYEDKVVLEIAEDVHIEVTRRAIANIVPEAVEEEPAEEEPDEEGEEDEAVAERDETAGDDEAAEPEVRAEVEERAR
ncbi:MAG TPA: preprotein translocase subunit YajC [Planctomycetota bacterium]|nr:preprotein translocase subunit YajC [Planctomycetota bacterium]